MGSMRTITQHSEVLDLAPTSILVDNTDTPMQLCGLDLLTILAGPAAGKFLQLTDPNSVVLPATVRWEPVS